MTVASISLAHDLRCVCGLASQRPASRRKRRRYHQTGRYRKAARIGDLKWFATKEECYAQGEHECANTDDQNREQLTSGCAIVLAFAPILKRCRCDEKLQHPKMTCSDRTRQNVISANQVPVGLMFR